MKIYSRRDSATTVLRKLGVDPSHYNKFIKLEHGTFKCDITKAEAFLKKASKPVKSKPLKSNKKQSPRVTMATTAYDLIRDGKTNAEVLAVLQSVFGLPENKNHYPAWYRAHMKRKGLLPKDAR